MATKTKILIILGVVLLLGFVVSLKVSYHIGKDNVATQSDISSYTCGEVTPDFCRQIAIITPADSKGNRYLQEAVANHLKKSLSAEEVVREEYKREPNFTSWTIDCPKVCIHQSVKEAIKCGADFAIMVKAPKWEYSLFPYIRKWNATVTFQGKQPKAFLLNELEPNYIDIKGTLSIDGRTTGIFNANYITSKAGQAAADGITNYLKERVKGIAEDYEEKLNQP